MLRDLFSGQRTERYEADPYIDAFELFYKKKIAFKNQKNAVGSEKHFGTSREEAEAHLLSDLYRNLDTLDSKASGLLSFCGVVLTAIAVVATLHPKTAYPLVQVLLFSSACASSILALLVINVHWSSAQELKDRSLTDACRSLFVTRQKRTTLYLIGWWTILITVMVFGLYVALDVILDESARQPQVPLPKG